MTQGENKRRVEDYIRQNPTCTYADIRKNTKIHVERHYKNMSEAYRTAGVPLTNNLTKRSKEQQKKDVIAFIQAKPTCTVTEIQNTVGVCIPRLYGSIINAYDDAGVKYQEKPITHGVRNPYVVKRCKDYEKQVVKFLENLGKVDYHIRTKTGIIDCLFTYKNKIFVVEIKDFRARNNITMSQLKQLIRYMEELNCENGLMICPQESFPKKKNSKNMQIGNKKIKIRSIDDLKKEWERGDLNPELVGWSHS